MCVRTAIVMTVLLLDASVWIAAFDVRDRYNAAARTLVAVGPNEPTLAALDLTLFEVMNVAVRKWRSADRASRLAELVEIASASYLERIDGELADYTIDTAEEHGLTVYDAAYVAVARRHGWTLVSTDIADLVRPGLAITPEDALALTAR
jgi:predicted nucleic acid-binding protein